MKRGSNSHIMQTHHKRFSVIGGFILLLIVLVAATLMNKRQFEIQASDREALAHTKEVLLELERTESLLKDAETGQRGFLYTGDPKYLAPYNTAVSQVEAQLDALAQATSQSPHQQARIADLRTVAGLKLKELEQTISLYKSGKMDDAKKLVLSDAGLRYMNKIRAQLDTMEADENSLAEVRGEVFHHSQRVTLACIYLSSLLAVLGLIALGYYILREMDLRERHARQMGEREEWFRVTLTSLGDAVIATDQNGLVTFVNPVAEELTGWSLAEAQGKTIYEVFPIFNEYTHQPVDNPVRKVMELGGIVGLANHTVLRNAKGELIPIEDSAAPIRDDRERLVGVVLVFRDATQERKSQEILRKTEKLAAAARLSATFAHEINNPLEAVVNLIYIVKSIEDMPAAAVQPLEMAEQELERVSHITRQTLGFYRESTIRGPVELPVVIENVIKLYSNKFSTKSIQVERNFSDCPPVHGLAGELTQAVSNLMSNAADAVSLKGIIRLHLSVAEDVGRDGRWIRLIVEDDGPGIPKELAERIFEPFFTTKSDIGNGLGLWVTKEIVERHGGRIDVVQGAGAGSSGARFAVLLPCDFGV
ncbi:CHASE3 domain-containing protein [Acidicapsa ligni]|uniref:CHASE3 domain-containing protein n=1 Tax=Acidicapsa ligni TaxID=542300 RepID=UPI0021E0D96D|nr:CHASE3 domain-containing protein [Acidicapsa ligni]